MMHGQLVFTLYYVVCILGPLEMAKAALLRNNTKIGGFLLCLMCGCQCLLQALFFDNLIFFLIPADASPVGAHLINALHVLSTLFAMAALQGTLR